MSATHQVGRVPPEFRHHVGVECLLNMKPATVADDDGKCRVTTDDGSLTAVWAWQPADRIMTAGGLFRCDSGDGS